MPTEQIQTILDQLVQTVTFLCNETANLVDDRSTRALNQDDAPGIRKRADQIRVAGRELEGMLNEAHLRS